MPLHAQISKLGASVVESKDISIGQHIVLCHGVGTPLAHTYIMTIAGAALIIMAVVDYFQKEMAFCITKGVLGVAVILFGWLLTAIGYSQETAFEPAVTNGIFNISTLVPAVGLIALALILWFWYPLHKKTVDANVAFLKEKHGR